MCNGNVSSYSCITLALHCAVTSRIGMLIAMGGRKGHWLRGTWHHGGASCGVYNSWKSWKSPGILLTFLENYIISNVIFAHQSTFSTLCVGKSSSKTIKRVGWHSVERWSEVSYHHVYL